MLKNRPPLAEDTKNRSPSAPRARLLRARRGYLQNNRKNKFKLRRLSAKFALGGKDRSGWSVALTGQRAQRKGVAIGAEGMAWLFSCSV